MALTLTVRAAKQIQSDLVDRGGGLGIRVIVQSSECSGMAYRLVFVDHEEAGDQVFESNGAKVYVDPRSMVWLDGTEIDYLEIGTASGFAFNNPNATKHCGCGDSFYV